MVLAMLLMANSMARSINGAERIRMGRKRPIDAQGLYCPILGDTALNVQF
jgi:hypothetical protein